MLCIPTHPRIPLLVTAALGLSAVSAGSARAEGDLQSELKRVVSIIKSNLNGATEVRVEPLRDLSAGTPLSGSIAVGLTEAFSRECSRQGLTVKPGAVHIVEGRFTVPDRSSLAAGEPLALEAQFGLLNRRGQQLVQILPIQVPAAGQPLPKNFALVDEPLLLAQAVGLVGIVSTPDSPTGSLTPEKISKVAQSPKGVSTGSLIKSAPQSLFEVEIRARRAGVGDYKPLPAEVVSGLPFVDIPKGYEYQIVVYNRSNNPVAVAPSIDGLSTFHFADPEHRDPITDELRNRHYIIGEKTSGVIGGWHFRNEGADNVGRFLVTNYGDSAANAIGLVSPGSAGAIHLEICEAVETTRRGKTRGIKGTKVGALDTVQFGASKLKPGKPLEFVTVRYDR